MDFRTDLALERQEITEQDSGGIRVSKHKEENARVTEIEIVTPAGAETIGKPIGRYITIELPDFSTDSEIMDGRLTAVTNAISELLPAGNGAVLVAGLGNADITPDALGPQAARGIFSTRHIDNRLAQEIGFAELRPVSAITFGVLGQTGIETGEIIKGIVDTIRPCAVITVDALASRNLSRLGNTVQLTNTGITPGSGVGNSRAEISEETLGVPVIAVGVPTVVDAATLVSDFTADTQIREDLKARAQSMMVTPREIDLMISRAAKLVSLSINCALQPSVDPEILLNIV